MSFIEACCTVRPVTSNYEEVGTFETIHGVRTYVVGPKDATIGLVGAHDIFGFHKSTLQFVDLLAEATGFRIVLPDLVAGDFFDAANFPPKDPGVAFAKFINVYTWDNSVGKIFENAIAYLKAGGVTKIGTFGYCWGAKQSIVAGRHPHLVQAVAALHPSLFGEEDFRLLQVPILNLPSKEEPDQVPFHAVLTGEVAAKSVHQRFDDMHHGWCAGRGDFSDPLNAKRTTEALQLVSDFFKSRL